MEVLRCAKVPYSSTIDWAPVHHWHIWNTVQRNGNKSATFFWPGSELPINGGPSESLRALHAKPFTYRKFSNKPPPVARLLAHGFEESLQEEGVGLLGYLRVRTVDSFIGTQPTYSKKYDGSIAFSKRAEQLISWLKLPEEERPRLLTLYYHQPDRTAHQFGPDSKNVPLKNTFQVCVV